jgi:hypothetical protein
MGDSQADAMLVTASTFEHDAVQSSDGLARGRHARTFR